MSRRTLLEPVYGFAWDWIALRARNASPWILATSNPQSTCHGTRPGPKLEPWCLGGLFACRGAERRRKDTRPEEKIWPTHTKKCMSYVCIYTSYTFGTPQPGTNICTLGYPAATDSILGYPAGYESIYFGVPRYEPWLVRSGVCDGAEKARYKSSSRVCLVRYEVYASGYSGTRQGC